MLLVIFIVVIVPAVLKFYFSTGVALLFPACNESPEVKQQTTVMT